MRILVLAQCYAPENVSAAVLITDLATDLVRRGHQVSVVTGAPSYPHGLVFDGYHNQVYKVEILDGVQVIRTWSYISPSKEFWPRLFHYGTYSMTAFYGGLGAERPDILISFSPPLPLGFSAWLLSRLWRIPWVLQLEDLYPDAAIAAGVMRNKNVISFFLWMENFLYQKSHYISVISKGFQQTLLAKKVPASKLEVIPVWADPDEVRPLPKNNSFRQAHNLGDRFVVMYAGNIGLTSCIEDVLQAAEILQDRTDIQFVIVGEGIKKCTLEGDARDKRLSNIIFLPYQPRENLPEMLAAADILLVTLNAGAALSSMPHKIFTSMASARPVLIVSPQKSELGSIVAEADCGWATLPGEPIALAKMVACLSGLEPMILLRKGQNGRDYLEKKHSRKHCIDVYENMLVTARNSFLSKSIMNEEHL